MKIQWKPWLIQVGLMSIFLGGLLFFLWVETGRPIPMFVLWAFSWATLGSATLLWRDY